MEAEARPLIESLGLLEDAHFKSHPNLSFRSFRGVYGVPGFEAIELLLSISGKDSRHGVDAIGTVPAALNTFQSLLAFKPRLVINAGTAGGFRKRGGEIAKTYLAANPVHFHDRRIPVTPAFDAYGAGAFRTAEIKGLQEALGIELGNVTTSDSFDATVECQKLMEKYQSHVKEMEAASVAWVCQMLDVPFIALKTITDLVDDSEASHSQFLRNLGLATKAVDEKVTQALRFLASHPDRW